MQHSETQSVGIRLSPSLEAVLMAGPQARQQKIGKAQRLYRQALQLDPTDLRGINGLGSLEARTGNYDAALRWVCHPSIPTSVIVLP